MMIPIKNEDKKYDWDLKEDKYRRTLNLLYSTEFIKENSNRRVHSLNFTELGFVYDMEIYFKFCLYKNDDSVLKVINKEFNEMLIYLKDRRDPIIGSINDLDNSKLLESIYYNSSSEKNLEFTKEGFMFNMKLDFKNSEGEKFYEIPNKGTVKYQLNRYFRGALIYLGNIEYTKVFKLIEKT